MKTIVFTLSMWFLLVAYVQADTQTFSSADDRVSIVELYTSEGCSSCPPAERWMNKFKHDDRLWKEFIPLAFHVDYWNDIGWPDRFSSPAYSERQRDYSAQKNLSTVYTPGVLLNGQEWREWYYKRPLQLDQSSSAGKLNVRVDTDQIVTVFDADQSHEHAYLNVALLGFDLMTSVQAGENRGKKLSHDFVVLGYQRIKMNKQADQFSLKTNIPNHNEDAPRMGLAVWVDDGSNLTPIQATGGWLAKAE